MAQSFEAQAGYIYAENNADAKSGQCAPAPDGSPEDVLRRNGITAKGDVSAKELYALAKAINQVERLHGGPIPESWRTPFYFHNSRGAWNQGANQINVRKQSYGGENQAALMHEFGHKVGNADGQKILDQYTSNTRTCGLSSYARSKRSEEFAEVFAAYVLNPEDLAKQCPGAYRFFSEKVFIKEAEASCSKVKVVNGSPPAMQPTSAPPPPSASTNNASLSGGFLYDEEATAAR